MCNHCSKLYVVNDFCIFCGNLTKDKYHKIKREYIKCHKDSCDNKAIYGNYLYPFCCREHSVDKLVSYYFTCDIKNFINIAQYMDNKFKPYVINIKIIIVN
jgi:hypothetical protein